MVVELNKLLHLIADKKASDLHLTVGLPPTVRLHGSLRPLNLPKLEPEDTVSFMRAIAPERIQLELKEKGGGDFGFAFEKKARFRVAVFNQKGNVGITLRLIPTKMLDMDEIGLPPSTRNMLDRPRGLILVTGPTGSGKTTTLASMINFINEDQDKHIITIEDPIEFYHYHKKSTINQREIGVDVPSFSDAIKRALRQDPDVILVGEMRDLETIEAAITAAETGHIVFATLHTNNAQGTVNRIIDAFPGNLQEQIRTQLSVALIGVVAQTLIPKIGGGRVAAFEVMINTPAVGNLIRKNETNKIQSTIQTSRRMGMVTLDDFILDLLVKGQIDRQVALDYAQDPRDLESRL